MRNISHRKREYSLTESEKLYLLRLLTIVLYKSLYPFFVNTELVSPKRRWDDEMHCLPSCEAFSHLIKKSERLLSQKKKFSTTFSASLTESEKLSLRKLKKISHFLWEISHTKAKKLLSQQVRGFSHFFFESWEAFQSSPFDVFLLFGPSSLADQLI